VIFVPGPGISTRPLSTANARSFPFPRDRENRTRIFRFPGFIRDRRAFSYALTLGIVALHTGCGKPYAKYRQSGIMVGMLVNPRYNATILINYILRIKT
jgi:hypothetical protein